MSFGKKRPSLSLSEAPSATEGTSVIETGAPLPPPPSTPKPPASLKVIVPTKKPKTLVSAKEVVVIKKDPSLAFANPALSDGPSTSSTTTNELSSSTDTGSHQGAPALPAPVVVASRPLFMAPPNNAPLPAASGGGVGQFLGLVSAQRGGTAFNATKYALLGMLGLTFGYLLYSLLSIQSWETSVHMESNFLIVSTSHRLLPVAVRLIPPSQATIFRVSLLLYALYHLSNIGVVIVEHILMAKMCTFANCAITGLLFFLVVASSEDQLSTRFFALTWEGIITLLSALFWFDLRRARALPDRFGYPTQPGMQQTMKFALAGAPATPKTTLSLGSHPRTV